MAEPPPRLIALDGLRGLAVMGILLMNITAFALPEAAYLNPRAYGGAGPADITAWALCFLFVDGKMRALFSLLFGASMLLVIERAEQAGEDGATVHLRRMATLLAIGLAHAYLLWSGDILMLYALTGTLALAFVDRGVRWLVGLGLVLILGQFLLDAVLIHDLAALRDAAVGPAAPPHAIDAWRAIADRVGIPSDAALDQALDLYRGGYSGILHERLTSGRSSPLLQLIGAGPETLGLMLLGMAGYRSGFLTGGWSRRAYARVAILAYAVGLPALALIEIGCIRSGFDEMGTIAASQLASLPFRPIVMAGHVAIALLWLGRHRDSGSTARIAAVGRAAFSNYIGTSLVMTTLFYGYGFGLFGQIGRAELYLIVPLAWAAMLAWSKPWLDRYRYGPLEWLWRSLARGALQPMRRDKAIAS